MQAEAARVKLAYDELKLAHERLGVSAETKLGVLQAEVASLETQLAQGRVTQVKKG